MMKHLNIRFHGRVQGVFFRDFVQKEAKKLDLRGFVRNDPDGTVYTEAEGEKKTLEEFLNLCKKGSQFANIEKMDVEEGEIKYFEDFVISY